MAGRDRWLGQVAQPHCRAYVVCLRTANQATCTPLQESSDAPGVVAPICADITVKLTDRPRWATTGECIQGTDVYTDIRDITLTPNQKYGGCHGCMPCLPHAHVSMHVH
jgi:hypothetical protein